MSGVRDDELARAIGANLRTARLNAGLTQERAARRIDTSQYRISEWGSGKYLISIPPLLALADTYAVSPLALLGREPRPAKGDT